MTIDWEADPQLRALRAEFVASFAERRARLANALRALPAGDEPCPAEELNQIQSVAHQVAGIAATYGFEELARVSEGIDERLDDPDVRANLPAAEVRNWVGELERCLAEGAYLRRFTDSR